MEKLERLQKEMQKAQEAHQKAFDSLPGGLDWFKFQEKLAVTGDKVEELSRQIRLIQPYTLSPLSKDAHVMPLEEFIDSCEAGYFNEYDGTGNYVKDGQRSDIDIYPSDIAHNSIRKDFDTIVWSNK